MGHRVTVRHDDEGRLVAVKGPPPEDPDRTRHEAELLGGLRHPGVVEVLEPDGDGPELRTRWVGARTAADLPRPLDPARAAGLVLAVAATVADLHRGGIIHGNLEPSHVLLDPHGRPVLCGFGDACRLDDERTPRASTDVAGLGGLLTELLTDADDAERAPRPPWRRRTGGRRNAEARALLAAARHATADDPSVRPGLRAFVDAVRSAAPNATLPASPDRCSSPSTDAPTADPDPNSPTTDPLLALLSQGPDEQRDEPHEITIRAPTADSPERTQVTDESGFWDDLDRLRPLGDPDGRGGRHNTWWGVGISAAGLAVVGFLGMSAVTGDPAPVPEAATPAPSTAPASTPTSLERSTAPPPDPASPATVATDPVSTDSETTIEHDGHRYAVGEPGDLVAVGDWRCDGRPTPAVYRPGTGSLFVFETWPGAGGRHEVEPLMAVPDGASLTAGPLDPDGCPSLVVGLADDPPVVLRPEELR